MSSQLVNRVAFSASAATALATSGYLFRDLADVSQWVIATKRQDVFDTFHQRHKLASISVGSMAFNTAIWWKTKPVSKYAWAAVNGTSLFLLYSGYVNPELMMRPRNRDAVYVSSDQVLDVLKREETVIVTQAGDGKPRAFPDSQVLRPHVARIGEINQDGTSTIMTYCGLTHLGMAFEIPPLPDGTPVELVPMTQLENNLVLLDKNSGQFGQQINGVSEPALLDHTGGESYQETKRKPSQEVLKKLHPSEVGKELPTWRMTLGNFVRTYPNGQVFINDYKMYKDLASPVKTVYDTLMDFIFETAVYLQATHPDPVFPTIDNIDPRLPPKEQVWAFNVGEDYVAVTETFVRDGNDVRNITVGGLPVVASWDKETASLGIWLRPSSKPIKKPVDIHGRVGGKGKPLERLSTVKNGAFWCVVANFFPDIRVNPES